MYKGYVQTAGFCRTKTPRGLKAADTSLSAILCPRSGQLHTGPEFCMLPGRMSSAPKSPAAPEKLREATAQVGEVAAREHVHVALLGGFALQHYGSQRLTGDIDIVAENRLRGLPAGKALSFGGEATHAPNGVPVDVVLRKDEFSKLYEEALTHARRIRSLPIPIVQPEYLAAMKMIAGRARDEVDLEFLILSKALVKTKARAVIKNHLGPWAAREWDRLVEEVVWKASKGRI